MARMVRLNIQFNCVLQQDNGAVPNTMILLRGRRYKEFLTRNFMIKKKICMVGVFAVGKTSLVQRFVKSMFSEKYLTTVGVKIDKKTMEIKGKSVELMLWDLQGEDEFQKLNLSYLRGASGYFLVVDSTRASTLEGALKVKEKVDSTLGNVPFLVLLNKVDLLDQWDIDPSKLKEFEDEGWSIMKTSAKTGQGVEESFQALALRMLED